MDSEREIPSDGSANGVLAVKVSQRGVNKGNFAKLGGKIKQNLKCRHRSTRPGDTAPAIGSRGEGGGRLNPNRDQRENAHTRRMWGGVGGGLVGRACDEVTSVVFGLNATELTWAMCPLSVVVFLPLATSHSLMLLSQLPEARVLPSGLNTTEVT